MFHRRLAVLTLVLLLVLVKTGSVASPTAPMLLWPLSVVPRDGDDKLDDDGLSMTTGQNGICETAVHPDSDDMQAIAVGCGAPNVPCVGPGPNEVLDSEPGGDDEVFGDSINTGVDGIRQTVISGDDEVLNEIALGRGLRKAICITAGPDGVIGYHPAPQGMSNNFGEMAVAGWFHDGVDVPGYVGTACIATIAGVLEYRENDQNSDVIIYLNAQSYPGHRSVNCLHSYWDTNDGDQPNPLTPVQPGCLISRLVHHPAYPHVHFAVYKRTQDPNLHINVNPLQFLTPPVQYQSGQPQIIQESIPGAPDLPLIMLFADRDTAPLVWHKHLKPEEDGAYIICGEDAPDCDIVASVGSLSDGTFLSGLGERLPLLPYAAGFWITGRAEYSFGGVTYQMDALPDWNDREEPAGLLFAEGSQPYQRHFIIFTNCDESTNYDELANVTENCWPTGQKDATDKWLVPQGEYTVSVAVADYGGGADSASVSVKVDRGQKEQPARGQ